MDKMLIIGIAGGTASGKSTIISLLKKKFSESITVLSHDNYYKLQENTTYEERAKVNYDSPDAFETELMASHISLLRQGLSIDCPVYDYSDHNRSSETIKIHPSPVLIIDGILILAEPKLRELMDIKIFVDTDADIRILRRINRDMTERGRTLESIMTQYLSTVKPMHEMYVEPSKKYADIIIPEGGHNLVAMEMLTTRVETFFE